MKLKDELKEETIPRKIDKIKYLIQRMVSKGSLEGLILVWYILKDVIFFSHQENQLREEKKRKVEEEKKKEEKQLTIDALNQGKMPYFATKCNSIFFTVTIKLLL